MKTTNPNPNPNWILCFDHENYELRKGDGLIAILIEECHECLVRVRVRVRVLPIRVLPIRCQG